MNLSEPIWTENEAVNLTKSGSYTLYSIADFSLLSNTFRKASHCALIHHTSTHFQTFMCPFPYLYLPPPVHTSKSWTEHPPILKQPPLSVRSAAVLCSRGILASPASVKQVFNTPPKSRALPRYKLRENIREKRNVMDQTKGPSILSSMASKSRLLRLSEQEEHVMLFSHYTFPNV